MSVNHVHWTLPGAHPQPATYLPLKALPAILEIGDKARGSESGGTQFPSPLSCTCDRWGSLGGMPQHGTTCMAGAAATL